MCGNVRKIHKKTYNTLQLYDIQPIYILQGIIQISSIFSQLFTNISHDKEVYNTIERLKMRRESKIHAPKRWIKL